jgi:hypothetical protein
MTIALSLNYTLCIFLYYPPLWVLLDLLSTFVLTLVTYVASEEDPNFVAENIQ